MAETSSADSCDNNNDPALLVPHLAKLEVSGGGTTHSSDPATPVESPQTLDTDVREWLNAALSAAASNPKVYAKLLVSNAAAGSIIGKGGGNINDFQQKSFAKIQLSKAGEYFPNTVERILMMTGRLKQVAAALGLIFSKLSKEGVAPLSPKSKAAAGVAGPGVEQSAEASAGVHLLVKLLVPQPLCGIIIGRSGTTIRQFAGDTQTTIKVTAVDGPVPPLSHRIVTVTGTQDGVIKAIALLTLKMSEDQKFSLFNSLPIAPGGAPLPNATGPGGMPVLAHSMAMALPYGPASLQPLQYMAMGPPHHPGAGMYPAAAQQQVAYRGREAGMQGGGSGEFTSLAISLTEEQGSFLLGPNGRGAADVAQASGVRVRVEKDVRAGSKGQYRKLVLSGPVEAVQFAQWLLGQKLAVASAAMAGGFMQQGAGAMPAAGMLPPGYMQQQVAGTTYFQPVMAAGPHAGYATQGMAAFAMPPQQMGPVDGQQHMHMVALGMPQPMQLRGGAPT